MTLDQIPASRLDGYISTNHIIGLRLDRLPNGKTVAAEVRRDEMGEHAQPYLDLAESPAIVVHALAIRCGLPILPGSGADSAEITAWKQSATRRAFAQAETKGESTL